LHFYLSFILLFLILHKTDNSWRSSFLLTAIIWGVFLAVSTETLSIFKLFTFVWLLGLWGLLSLALSFIYFFKIKKLEPNGGPKISESRFLLKFFFLCVGLLVAIVGVIALVAPPNNLDSMTYHMSRVVHWIQNHSVAHYPTHMSRQLYMNPWAEFAVAHFQILSGGDRFANLLQWFSMIGSILGVTLIAKQLGAKTEGQIFAAVVTATIPMGILQASSTKNDYVVSFWLVCFVYYVLLLLREKTNWTNVFSAGASLGLAILTKGTAYIFAFPFLLWFFLSGLKRLRWKLWKPVFLIIILVFSINLGHYMRNFNLYGFPLGPFQVLQEHKLTNDVFTIPTSISLVVRNLGLHMGTPIGRVNNIIERGIRLIHSRLLGLDINDPRTTWRATEFHIKKIFNHDGNPIHLFLVLFAIVFLIIHRNPRKRQDLANYFVAVAGGFLLFCFLFKWQPWHTRLHLPLFVLWSPATALVLSENKKWLADSLMIVLLVASLWWVFYNHSRPLVGRRSIFVTSRIEQYFNNRPDLEVPYIEATRFINAQKYHHIGLSFGGDQWEYPFWVLLQKNTSPSVRIEHIDVQNISNVISRAPFTPDATICIMCSKTLMDNYMQNVGPLHRFGLVDVFAKESPSN